MSPAVILVSKGAVTCWYKDVDSRAFYAGLRFLCGVAHFVRETPPRRHHRKTFHQMATRYHSTSKYQVGFRTLMRFISAFSYSKFP